MKKCILMFVVLSTSMMQLSASSTIYKYKDTIFWHNEYDLFLSRAPEAKPFHTLDPSATVVVITNCYNTDLSNLKAFPDIEQLSLVHYQGNLHLQWDHVLSLKRLKELQLDFDHGFLEWRGFPFFETLNRFENLEHLVLGHFLPSPQYCQYFGQIPNLKQLTFHRDVNKSGRFFDVNIEGLNYLTQISSLEFFFMPITSDNLDQLNYVCLPNLDELVFWDCSVKGLKVRQLAPNLKHLILRHSNIAGATVASLSGMDLLEDVDLSYTNITSGAVKNLSKLPSLREIRLAGTNIKGANFSIFHALTNLELLDLSDTNISRADLSTVHGLSQLKKIKLVNLTNTTIRQEDIQDLIDALPDCVIEINE